MPGGPDDGGARALGGARLTVPLWPHQERALAAFSADQAGAGQAAAASRGDERGIPRGVSHPGPATGSRSSYLVIPPGGGKTMIGLEAARRAGRRTLVLCPNTAIQAQWISQWHSAFGPPPQARATMRRDLPTALTVLTYQAVATFDDLATPSPGALVDSLHANGRQLLAARKSGSWTLVLDECHHLLE